jgi:hypothetical protein
MIGKWHLKSNPKGYDHWAILPGQGRYHYPRMIVNGGPVQFRGYVDDVIGDQCLETLKTRPRDRPFCIQMQFKAPHRAWQPAKRWENQSAKQPASPTPLLTTTTPVQIPKSSPPISTLGSTTGPPPVSSTASSCPDSPRAKGKFRTMSFPPCEGGIQGGQIAQGLTHAPLLDG